MTAILYRSSTVELQPLVKNGVKRKSEEIENELDRNVTEDFRIFFVSWQAKWSTIYHKKYSHRKKNNQNFNSTNMFSNVNFVKFPPRVAIIDQISAFDFVHVILGSARDRMHARVTFFDWLKNLIFRQNILDTSIK